MVHLDLIQTLAFAGAALLAGYGLRRIVPVLHRYNLPAPVIGGLTVALLALFTHQQDLELLRFDTTLQTPLMIAFFTTIGFGASLSLLKAGGPLVARFLAIATVFAVIQNLVGAGVAVLFGLDPLFGVLAGSVTLTGGPATGLAFAPLFEQAGVAGADSIAVAVAMGGIIFGGLVGSPAATSLIERYGLAPAGRRAASGRETAPPRSEIVKVERIVVAEENDDEEAMVWPVLRNLVVVLLAMGIGGWISKGFATLGLTLPVYIGAMLVAAAIRNLDDRTGWIGLSHRFIGAFGIVALSLFLVLALMTLKLWELASLALPLLTVLAVQVAVVLAACFWPVFQLMGRDYEAAVSSGGFIGFMLGTTANAMAVMRAIVERYGPAPTAFLVAPLVGAFFLDFTNALIITVFLNLLG